MRPEKFADVISQAPPFPVEAVGPAALAVRQTADEVSTGEVDVLIACIAGGGVAQVGQVDGRHARGLLDEQQDGHAHQAANCGQHNSSSHDLIFCSRVRHVLVWSLKSKHSLQDQAASTVRPRTTERICRRLLMPCSPAGLLRRSRWCLRKRETKDWTLYGDRGNTRQSI